MNLLILGATGRIGQHVLTLSLQHGGHVTAFVRDPQKINLQHPNLTIFQGDARVKSDIHQAMAGVDVIISALSSDGSTTLSEAIFLVIGEMKKRGLKRIISVGTAGILQSRIDPSHFRFQSNESRRTNTFATQEHAKVYCQLARSDLDWTIVCPTHLKQREPTGIYRFEPHFLPEGGTEISFSDAAQFTYQQISSTLFIKARVGIAY